MELANSETVAYLVEALKETSVQLQREALFVAAPSAQIAQIAKQFALEQSELHRLLAEGIYTQPNQFAKLAEEFVSAPFLLRFCAATQPVLESAFELLDQYKSGAERLAKSGWTLPMHMTAREMFELVDLTDDDKIDERFVAFYEETGMFPRLRRHVLSSKRLGDWQPLLEQCFENYETGKYLICIPALLSAVLEGSLARPDGAMFVKAHERIAYFKSKIDACDPDSLNHAMWNSMNTFVAMLYQKRDFGEGVRPAKLNRHWILHGRDVPSAWRRADALRLFHALSTLRSLCH